MFLVLLATMVLCRQMPPCKKLQANPPHLNADIAQNQTHSRWPDVPNKWERLQ